MNTTAQTRQPITRAPRLAAAALLCLGTVALAPAAAHADPGNGQGQGLALAPGQAQGQAPTAPTPALPEHAHVNGGRHGNQGQHGNAGQQHGNAGQQHGNQGHQHGNGNGGHAPSAGHGASPAAQDPAGNNGTVKIAPLGDFDGIPNNTPHVGCTFLVEWYGFDEGAGISSTVSFAEHAPTTGVGMTVDGPSSVFVGEDPASGAGTDTGLDARQPYTLSFTGQPHPQQGYHVKLTVRTPGSIGNDTKSKVFWVQGCAPTTPPVTPTTPETAGTPQAPGTSGSSEVLPETATAAQAPEVLGEQAFAPTSSPHQQQPQLQSQPQLRPQSQHALPTSVNAGASPTGAPTSGTDSLLGLLLVLLGAVSARLGWIRARG